jgi:hypothetical protein
VYVPLLAYDWTLSFSGVVKGLVQAAQGAYQLYFAVHEFEHHLTGRRLFCQLLLNPGPKLPRPRKEHRQSTAASPQATATFPCVPLTALSRVLGLLDSS